MKSGGLDSDIIPDWRALPSFPHSPQNRKGLGTLDTVNRDTFAAREPVEGAIATRRSRIGANIRRGVDIRPLAQWRAAHRASVGLNKVHMQRRDSKQL